MENKRKKYYRIQIECVNCGFGKDDVFGHFAKSIKIEKGILLENTECPKCGCKKLLKK